MMEDELVKEQMMSNKHRQYDCFSRNVSMNKVVEEVQWDCEDVKGSLRR